MKNALELIKQFNDVRGLTEKGFDPVRENAFLLSEELETLEWWDYYCEFYRAESHDEVANEITKAYGLFNDDSIESKVEYADKVFDHFFFGGGGMLKMGMSIEQIMECFLAVCYANLAKGSKTVNGKITKDDSFEAIDPKHVIRKVLESIEA